MKTIGITASFFLWEAFGNDRNDCWIARNNSVCTRCPEESYGGSGCTIKNTWFQCHADITSCCHSGNPILEADECVKNTPAGLPFPCDKLVSKDEDVWTTEKCFQTCQANDPSLIPTLQANCWIGEEAGAMCYQNYIYGYSEKDGHYGIDWSTVATPTECQIRCQDNPDCTYWAYGITDGRCILKSQEYVDGALNQVIDRTVPVNTNYCDALMYKDCVGEDGHSGIYNCKVCGVGLRCVWESANFITGPKYCKDIQPECRNIPDGTTAAPTPGDHTTTLKPDPHSSTTTTTPKGGSTNPSTSTSTSTSANSVVPPGAIAGGAVGVVGFLGAAGFGAFKYFHPSSVTPLDANFVASEEMHIEEHRHEEAEELDEGAFI